MDKKIFLEKFGSKQSVNTTEGLNVPLKGNRRLLPTGEYAGIISAYDQYMKERGACNTIRLTCQVNTVCSNVLFNRISEIVRDEGSDKVTFLNYAVLDGESDGTGGTLDDKSVVKEDETIYYKPTTMDYWSGDSINYVSNIVSVSSSSPEEDLSDITVDAILPQDMDMTNSDKLFHPSNAIRDTQLSNDNYVYHCGLDFFNNHLIRSNTFKTICKFNDTIDGKFDDKTNGYTAFNTIADLMRDINGDCVVEKIGFPVDSGIPGNVKTTALHLYTADDIDTFADTIAKRRIEKYNGWIGFYNRSKIKSYDTFTATETTPVTELPIDKPLMYKNGGDFVDMYPGHELYSFVPMYNKYRNRFEKNWNYCVTYPSSSTTYGFEDIFETNNNSLKAIYFDENTRADNGTSQLVIYSIAKHGLKVGDYVNIYTTVSGDTTKIIDNAEVSQVADDYIFTVFNAGVQISEVWVEIVDEDEETDTGATPDTGTTPDTGDTSDPCKEYYSGGDEEEEEEDKPVTIVVNGKTYTRHPSIHSIYLDENFNKYYVINDKYINLDENAQHISYKKVVNDIECDYYVRIFTRVPNFRFASGDTSSYYEISKKDEEGKTKIDKYSDYKYEFESQVSRLAFAKNIYSDDIGQIVFTDDINIANLKDNLGRPLTKLYLTIIKNNKGYKEWYGYDYDDSSKWSETNITGENIEYSHCFGKITCGIDTSDESVNEDTINSIKKLSNIGLTYGYDVSLINPDRTYETEGCQITQNEVSYEHDNSFYGDLCCYDYYNALETSIQPILHRFNTAQRESRDALSSHYFRYFNYDEVKRDDYDTDSKFLIDVKTIGQCNEKQEGYYYIPHYEIPIRSFGKIQYMLPDLLDIRSITAIDGTTKRIHTQQYHHLQPGDKALIYDVNTRKHYFLTTIMNPESNDKVFFCTVTDEKGNEAASRIADLNRNTDDVSVYSLFKLDNMNIPDYATLLKDGTCRYIWRDVINNGLDGGDTNLEEFPFTNGAFYVNKRIDLYLRRQDPYGVYGMYADDDIFGEEILIEDENNYIEDEDITC